MTRSLRETTPACAVPPHGPRSLRHTTVARAHGPQAHLQRLVADVYAPIHKVQGGAPRGKAARDRSKPDVLARQQTRFAWSVAEVTSGQGECLGRVDFRGMHLYEVALMAGSTGMNGNTLIRSGHR